MSSSLDGLIEKARRDGRTKVRIEDHHITRANLYKLKVIEENGSYYILLRRRQ